MSKDSISKDAIVKAVHIHGNQTEAAKYLGISKQRVSKVMKEMRGLKEAELKATTEVLSVVSPEDVELEEITPEALHHKLKNAANKSISINDTKSLITAAKALTEYEVIRGDLIHADKIQESYTHFTNMVNDAFSQSWRLNVATRFGIEDATEFDAYVSKTVYDLITKMDEYAEEEWS